MKPLPAQQTVGVKSKGDAIPSLPTTAASLAGDFSKTNRRTSCCPVQRAYPWLLSTSTAVAALFCLLYITKPVITTAPGPLIPTAAAKPAVTLAAAPSTGSALMPGNERLPGESTATGIKPTPTDPRRALSGSPSTSAFEETNIRIQHILTAEAPGGHLDRIDIDVPVLYQSRSLRWTADEVAEARSILTRLMDYQDKSRTLRAEGLALLDSWNSLIENSIPTGDLRADSPSLPANQEDAADAPRPAGLITTESIQIQPSGK